MKESREKREKVDQYRELFERSADAILLISGDTFIDCNDATVKMLRYRDKKELLQTHPSALSPEFQSDGRPSFEKANELMKIAFDRGSHRFEWDHKRADGEVFPVEVLLTAVPQDDRQILHVVWRDITDRKKLEAELLHVQKMEGIGQLAGAVAHDFNNMLAAIIGYSELLAGELSDQPELRSQVKEIHRAAERAAEMTSQLLACSRKQVFNVEVVDLNDILTSWSRMIQVLCGARTKVEFDLCSVPLFVCVDAGQIEQVVLNITTNSRDAMPNGGSLIVRTREVRLENEEEFGVPDGSYALLSIRDDGVGMPTEDLTRAFDPFFTTKERGRGTGLGLASVHGIVTQGGGAVRIHSQEKAGTTVDVFIPVVDAEAAATTRSVSHSRPQSGKKARVLLAEDDSTVARLVTRILQREGLEVHAATDGKKALDLARELGFQFDLLLTDVIMPVMNGPELARRIHAEVPDLAIVFMSGYADTALAEEGFDADEVDLIRKPFSISELNRRVKAALSG